MCTWPNHRKREKRFDSGKSGNHDWLKKKHWLQLEVINYTFTYLYYTLHGITNIQTLFALIIRPDSFQEIPMHQAMGGVSPAACRLPRQGTWLPSVSWWSKERWHSGKKASCSVGWVCLQLGDGTLRKVQESCGVFFLTKKIGICHVCDNLITSQPVLFILCIPKRYKRKKNSVKRRCFILYSLPLSISILLVLASGKSKSFLRKFFQKVRECLRQSSSGTLIMGSVKLSCVAFLLGKSF